MRTNIAIIAMITALLLCIFIWYLDYQTAHGDELTVSARVEGLQVKALPYQGKLQPAVNPMEVEL